MKKTKQTPKEKMDAFVASLLPDSDRKMGSIAGISLLVALALSFWATTYERLIDDMIFEHTENEVIKATLDIMNKQEEKKETPKEKKKPKEEVKRKRPGGGGKPSGKGNPKAPVRLGVLKLLESQTRNASAAAYDLMRDKFAKDIDKVLKSSNGLQLTGKTSIGEIRGKVDGGFNEGVAAGGSGGLDDIMGKMFGGAGGPITTKALKGRFKPPSEKDIDMGLGNSSRSASDIMKVVRNRTPGLRHIYNKHLKKNPGFQGKVTLKFTIAPGGEIISMSIVSSTTGYGEFDNEVKNAVSRWTFNKVKSGNTTVTIPFTFSE